MSLVIATGAGSVASWLADPRAMTTAVRLLEQAQRQRGASAQGGEG